MDKQLDKKRLQQIGNLMVSKKEEKKAKRKAKFRARVKLKVEKRLKKKYIQLGLISDKVTVLRSDIESFNPNFHALQIHTKTKWVSGLQEIENLLEDFIKKKAEEIK